jgi:hypothetical protein
MSGQSPFRISPDIPKDRVGVDWPHNWPWPLVEAMEKRISAIEASGGGGSGTSGEAATIEVGSTYTGEPGTDAQVTNSGNSSHAVLDFVIPRGAAGPQGLQGPQGPKGDPGTDAGSFYVITSESTTWVDLENTISVADAALPNPVTLGSEYTLDSPLGNKLVMCDILIKEEGQWVYQTAQTYSAQGNTFGATAFGPGDGKIYLCIAPDYMHFSSAEGKGSRAPNLSVTANRTGAEIVIICRPS